MSGLPGSKCWPKQSIIELKVTKFGEIVNKEFGEGGKDRILGDGSADLSLEMSHNDSLMNVNGTLQDENMFTPINFD